MQSAAMIASQHQLMRRASQSVTAGGSPPTASAIDQEKTKPLPPTPPTPPPALSEQSEPTSPNTQESTLTDGAATSPQQQTTATDKQDHAGSPARQISNMSTVSDRSTTPKKRVTKRSSSSWLNLLNPSYKTRSEEFKKYFSAQVPSNERLVVDYSCALQKEILVHGRVYISLNYFCFYANIFKWETSVVIKCSDITALTKANTARVIPNAIQIETIQGDKIVLTSFAARDKTYVMCFRIWQNALMGQQMSSAELWSWVHYSYGDDLGYTSEEEEVAKDRDAQDARDNNNLNNGLNDSVELNPRHLAMTDSIEAKRGDFVTVEQNNGIELRPLTRPHSHLEEDEEQQASDDEVLDAPSAPAAQSSSRRHEPITCDCEEHSGKLLVKETFQFSPDVLFSLIFTDSLFYRKLIDDRKTYDLTINPWTDADPNDNQGNDGAKVRELTYTVTVNHALAKDAKTTEVQTIVKSQPGKIYIVKSEANNHGVPYCDNFCTRSHWCLTRGAHESETQLLVHGEVFFKSNPWTLRMVKPLIEKSAMQGVTDYAVDCATALSKYGVDDGAFESDTVSMDRLQKLMRSGSLGRSRSLHEVEEDDVERRFSDARFVDDKPAGSVSFTALNSTIRSRSGTMTFARDERDVGGAVRDDNFVLKIILGILFLLFISNIFLYMQLWKLEKTANEYDNFYLSSSELTTSPEKLSLTAQSIEKWKQVLAKAVKLISLMERNLEDINGNFKDEL